MLRLAALAAVTIGLVAVGCSSDNSSNPTPHNTGGSGGTGTGGTGGTGTGGTGTGGTAGSGTGGMAGANTGGSAGAVDCYPDGSTCYNCAPTTSDQLLNHCTNASCVPYDNTKLSNLLSDGGLPPLP